jgi:hypothetical protein
MSQTSRWVVLLTVAGILAAVVAAPALAIFPQLTTKLAGSAINGMVPTGDAKVDQSKLPAQPLTLQVKVKSVNLPDGTVLSVVLTDCGASSVGTITLSKQEGQLQTTVPGCQVGRQSAINVNNGATTILSGGAPWNV